MSDPSPIQKKPEPKWLKPIVDYVPLAAFMIAYWQGDLILATKAIMIATGIAIILSLIVARRVPIMPLVTASVIAIFGGLTLYLNDERFIKMKPTIIELIFASVLAIGLFFNKLWLKPLFGGQFTMPDHAWRTITWRFVMFFVVAAALNEAIWRTQSTDLWVTFKVFGLMGMTFVFIISQLPFINKHNEEDLFEGDDKNSET